MQTLIKQFCRNDAPTWVEEAVKAAHVDVIAEFSFPDDWRCKTIQRIAQEFAEYDDWDFIGEEEIDDRLHEIADALVDVYDADLISWFVSHPFRAVYVDEAMELGYVDSSTKIMHRLRAGQFLEILEIARQLMFFMQDEIESR